MNYDISIIIPFLNVRPYIEDCLSSILNSDIDASYEIIMIDDGSTDGSLEIAASFASKFPFIHIHQCPGGKPSTARNLGVRLSKGEYIYYIDSDDRIEPDYLRNLFRAAKEQNAEIVYAGFKRFYDDTKEQEIIKRDFLKNQGLYSGIEVLHMRMDSNDWYNQVWCGIYQKSFLTENNITFPDDFLVYEDILYSSSVLLYAKRVKLIENDGYLYRMREKSLVSGGPKPRDLDAGLKLIDRFTEIYPVLNQEQKKVWGRVLFQIVSMVLYYVGVLKPENRNDIYKKIHDRKTMNILKSSISGKKELVKFLIFKYCISFYYSIVK